VLVQREVESACSPLDEYNVIFVGPLWDDISHALPGGGTGGD
jgi:hypothetical protein